MFVRVRLRSARRTEPETGTTASPGPAPPARPQLVQHASHGELIQMEIIQPSERPAGFSWPGGAEALSAAAEPVGRTADGSQPAQVVRPASTPTGTDQPHMASGGRFITVSAGGAAAQGG